MKHYKQLGLKRRLNKHFFLTPVYILLFLFLLPGFAFCGRWQLALYLGICFYIYETNSFSLFIYVYPIPPKNWPDDCNYPKCNCKIKCGQKWNP